MACYPPCHVLVSPVTKCTARPPIQHLTHHATIDYNIMVWLAHLQNSHNICGHSCLRGSIHYYHNMLWCPGHCSVGSILRSRKCTNLDKPPEYNRLVLHLIAHPPKWLLQCLVVSLSKEYGSARSIISCMLRRGCRHPALIRPNE